MQLRLLLEVLSDLIFVELVQPFDKLAESLKRRG